MYVYNDYARAREGFLWGLDKWQVFALAALFFPALLCISFQKWMAFLPVSLLAGIGGLLVVVPLGGRPAPAWIYATVMHYAARLLKWSNFRSRAGACRTATKDLEGKPDLPGVLQSSIVHDGPAQGGDMTRVALVQHRASRSWSVTAQSVHPGIGLQDEATLAMYGDGLRQLLEVARNTEIVSEVTFSVRTVPGDDAERRQWVSRHQNEAAPDICRVVSDDLDRLLSTASVRTESYVTLTCPERKLAREARTMGGGLRGRGKVLLAVMAEMEDKLQGAMGAASVRWLSSPELAVPTRTAFSPGDRGGIVDAQLAAHETPGVNAEVPWSNAGPLQADPRVRFYTHEAWASVSSLINLPARGVAMGDLAPVLIPSGNDERRSLAVTYPIVPEREARRHVSKSAHQSHMREVVRQQLKQDTRVSEFDRRSREENLDAKVSRGATMVTPYAVATATVPRTAPVLEHGRRLDGSIRRSGFSPLRLDMSHDRAFVASTVPLGITLTNGGKSHA